MATKTSPNGTIASPAWSKDDYILNVRMGDLEIDEMISLMKAQQTLENFGDIVGGAQFIATLEDLKTLVIPFIERRDGKAITSAEAVWRAGKMKFAEFGDLFGGATNAEIPPQSADS